MDMDLYGHILEEVLLLFTRVAGHTVTDQQKQIDAKSSINSDMLLSVQLKKGKKKDIIKSDMNGFEPPSLNSLQQALQNLRTIIGDS